MRPKVYIAGPISKGNHDHNFRLFTEAHHMLAEAGAAVLNPGLTMKLPCHEDISHDEWMAMCLPWVQEADFLIRLPGHSVGADDEVRHALKHNVRVFIDREDIPGDLMHLAQWHGNWEGPPNGDSCEREPWDREPGEYLVHWFHRELLNPAACLRFFCNQLKEGCLEKLLAKQGTQDQSCDQTGTCASGVDTLMQILAERGKVYGEPKQNHEGIAMMWAPMLEPHWQDIRDQKPLPPHVVALLMVLLKVDRMRITWHQDNYDDARNYLGFAEKWQKESKGGDA